MGVVLLSHVCNNDILYILCYLVICKCGFRFCLCALLSQSHVCWVIYTQLMHVDTGIVEYTFITYYIYSILGFNIWIFFQILLLNFLGGPHYWDCSFTTSVRTHCCVCCCVNDLSSQPAWCTPGTDSCCVVGQPCTLLFCVSWYFHITILLV